MAVYTDLPDQELQRFLTDFDIGAATSCKGIAEGVENSNFLLRTESGTYILTLFEKRVKEEDLPYFIGLMDHCQQAGFPCPHPIANKKGAKISRLCGKAAAIVTFLEGIWPKQPEEFHCRELGLAMADFHEKARSFPLRRENALSLKGWRPLSAAILPNAHRIDPALPELLSSEMGFLDANWPTDLPLGNIHADLFPDNVFFMGKKITGFIDFYFCCTDFLAYDLAVALNAWAFDRQGFYRPEMGRQLLQSYQTKRTLNPAERKAFPVLSRGAALRFLLTRAYDWLYPEKDALVMPKDPLEYMRKLEVFRAEGREELFFG